MSQSNENIAESIITLSKEPVKELSSIMININDYLQYLESAPFIAKPFVRKDLSAVTDMNVKELYELLNRIKESLEKIDTAASLIKAKKKQRKYIFNERFARIRKEKEDKPADILEVEPKKTTEGKMTTIYVFCPECGHKCKGQNGLKIHVRIKHKEKEKEILKMMRLYDK